MVELSPLSPFSFVRRGSYGVQPASIQASEFSAQSTAILARAGQNAALDEALAHLCGLSLPAPNRFTSNARMTLIAVGPGQWLALGPDDTMPGTQKATTPPASLFASLQPLAPHAALSDQSDGRACLRLSGAALLPMLRKGLTLDLHNFAPGHAASTLIHHVSALVWRESATQWAFAVPRSFAGSFWHWVESSAAEFGLEMTVA